MKRVALLVPSLGLVLLGTHSRSSNPSGPPMSRTAVVDSLLRIPLPQPLLTPTRYTSFAPGNVGGPLALLALAATPVAKLKPKSDDRAQIRRTLRKAQVGTYIGDILLQRDSSIARWPDRKGKPLTIWIQPKTRVADFTPAYVERVREAFLEWDALRLPVRFAFVKDSADAEVHVTWIDRFKTAMSGLTRWSRDDDWVITNASITLAMHHYQGELLDEESMHAMALHEIGHLLGLDHTQDENSVMAPKVRVRHLSAADRATVRLLYALPAGPLR